jgi:hypothetical protein
MRNHKSEFCVLHNILETYRDDVSNTNPILKPFDLPALLNLQFHMIARIDDTTQVLLANLRMHETFPTNLLKTRLNWSKNVHEDCDTPWEMVLGLHGHSLRCPRKYCIVFGAEFVMESKSHVVAIFVLLL